MKRRRFLTMAALTGAGILIPDGRNGDALAAKMSLTEDDVYWRRAWLYAIASAEGLASYGREAYSIAYRYKRYEGFDDHPRERAVSRIPGTDKVSNASGPYQILETTWDGCRRKHPNIWLTEEPDFSPGNQDRCGLALSWDAGGHRHLLDGCRVSKGHLTVGYESFKRAVFADSIEWAPFPGYDIGAATGQNTRPLGLSGRTSSGRYGSSAAIVAK